MQHLFILIIMLLGGLGLGLSLWYPAHNNLSSDQHMGFGMAGLGWLIACFSIAIFIGTH